MVLPLLKYICNLHFTGLPLKKSCSTYDMPGLGTSLREHLGWSSGTSRFWSSLQNIPWMYRQGYFLHLWQFTTVSSKGIPLRLLTYFLPLMMESMLKIMVSWQQNIQGRQRKTEPMLDVNKSQRVQSQTAKAHLFFRPIVLASETVQ